MHYKLFFWEKSSSQGRNDRELLSVVDIRDSPPVFAFFFCAPDCISLFSNFLGLISTHISSLWLNSENNFVHILHIFCEYKSIIHIKKVGYWKVIILIAQFQIINIINDFICDKYKQKSWNMHPCSYFDYQLISSCF